MPYNLNSLSKNKKELKTEKMKVPAILHVSDELLPNDATLSEIEDTSASGYVFHHYAAMSDVHSKKGRKNPAGTVVATEHELLPQINDTAPNCGMRLLKTSLTDQDLTPENIDKLFTALLKPIPTKAYVGTKIPYSLVMDICRKGVAPITQFFGTRTKNEIENSFDGGTLFDEEPTRRQILDAIPELFLRIGQLRLGILGAAGNHFLDLMKVTEIKNPRLAEKLGLFAGQYVFLLHTGSGLLGQYASYLYTPKKKEHLSQRIVLALGKMTFQSQMKKVYQKIAMKIDRYKNTEEFLAYDDDTLEGDMFITAHRASANHGFANRSILTHNLDTTIQNALGVDPNFDLLYDMPHVYVDKENHYGKDVWIHRNNASRAYGPTRMATHPLFSQTGEPVFIPSSMSTPAYIAVGTDKNESTFFSAPHGTGRRKDYEKDAAKNKAELFKKMKQQNVRLYNAKSKGVVLQDSSYYKDVEEVIKGMEENEIVNVVAKMEPIAVLMY